MKEREVKGKVEALGLPARREMTPGVRSRGKRQRTNSSYASEIFKGNKKYVGERMRRGERTRARLSSFSYVGEEVVVVLCGEDCCRFVLREETTRKRMMSSVLGFSDSGRMTRSGTGVWEWFTSDVVV